METRTLACLFAFALAACSSAPPRPEEKPPAPTPPPAPAPLPTVDDGFRIDYRPQAEGKTLLEVVEPAGAEVIVWDAGTQLAHDKAPLAVDAASDKYYRVDVRLPSGSVKEKKVQARSGQVASVRLVVAADAGPQPMSREAFHGLVKQVDQQSGGDVGKMALLKTALAYNWITSAMAGVLLEHIVYRQSKLDVLPLLRDRILDRENAYLLIEHYVYREDKAKAQEVLAH